MLIDDHFKPHMAATSEGNYQQKDQTFRFHINADLHGNRKHQTS